MANQIDALAEALASLRDWNESRQAPVAQQVESLSLIVQQMATSLALHEVQIAKLREAIVLLSVKPE